MIYIVTQYADQKVDSVWHDKPAAEARVEELARSSWLVALHEVAVGVPSATVNTTHYPAGPYR